MVGVHCSLSAVIAFQPSSYVQHVLVVPFSFSAVPGGVHVGIENSPQGCPVEPLHLPQIQCMAYVARDAFHREMFYPIIVYTRDIPQNRTSIDVGVSVHPEEIDDARICDVEGF